MCAYREIVVINWYLLRLEVLIIAVDTFNHLNSFNRVKSAQSVSDSPKICAWRWHSNDGHLPSTFESAQCVDTGWIWLLCATEIETCNRQDFLISIDPTFLYWIGEIRNHFFLFKMNLPLSTSCSGAAESQLHFIKDSTQFPSMPHWQVWTSVSAPAQKYLAFPLMSFHQE